MILKKILSVFKAAMVEVIYADDNSMRAMKSLFLKKKKKCIQFYAYEVTEKN